MAFEPPGDRYLAKLLFSWDGDPEIGGTGGFYQPLLDTDGRDRECYIVDDGQQFHAGTVICSSELFGKRRVLGHESTPERYVDRMGRLLSLMDTQALGVDAIEAEGTRYAVDCNAAPSFREAGLDSPNRFDSPTGPEQCVTCELWACLPLRSSDRNTRSFYRLTADPLNGTPAPC